jgi:hypothetical protein
MRADLSLGRKGASVKTFLAIALVMTAGLAALWMWGSVHARLMSGPSSQIFIHGTPVCVTQRGGDIEAAIGECGSSSGASEGGWDGFHRTPRPFGNMNPGLPPGHPPIGGVPDLGEEAVRRIPI